LSSGGDRQEMTALITEKERENSPAAPYSVFLWGKKINIWNCCFAFKMMS